jgi:hypothetical protein
MPVHVLDIGRLGPVVSVGLSVGDAYASAGLGGAPQSYNALIDTGASDTAISTAARQALQPQRVRSVPYLRPGMPRVPRPSYDIRLKFEGHLSPFLWFDVEVIEVNPATPGIDVLIGQDLIQQLTLLSNGPLGKLVLMY